MLFCQRGGGCEQNGLVQFASHRKSVWVEWVFDLIARDDAPIAKQSAMIERDGSPTLWRRELTVMDVAYVKERSQLDEYRAAGINARYLDQACPSDMPAATHEELPTWDVVVIGTPGKAWRQRYHDVSILLSEGFSVAWAGHPRGDVPRGALPLPFCPALSIPRLASNAAVVLSVDLRQDLDGYRSDRLWLCMGAGACVAHRRGVGLPTAVESRAACYDTDGELVSLVSDLRRDVNRRRHIGEAARRYVMQYHTYENRLKQILRDTTAWSDRRKASAASVVGAVA